MSSIISSLSPASSPAIRADESRRAAAPAKERDWFQPNTESEQNLSFRDFLSAINPLQHIPVVGSVYRAITGDAISPVSRVMGGLLFGGPIGLVASALNAVVEQTTGKDLGEQALALVIPDKSAPAPAEPPAQFASAALAQQPEQTANEDAALPPASPPALTPVAALGGDRTLGGSLLNPHVTAAGAPPAQGRTLADYRNFNGRSLPIIDGSRSGSSHAAPVRLQPSAPLQERTRAVTPLPAPRESKAVEPASAESPTGGSAAATAASPASDGFVSAMARGLDRYREQRRMGATPLQIDTTL